MERTRVTPFEQGSEMNISRVTGSGLRSGGIEIGRTLVTTLRCRQQERQQPSLLVPDVPFESCPWLASTLNSAPGTTAAAPGWWWIMLTRLVCAMSQSRTTALANDFALLALTHFASTLKDGSSLIAERKVKLDNKALVRSTAALAQSQTKLHCIYPLAISPWSLAPPRADCISAVKRVSTHLFRDQVGLIVTFRPS